MLTVCLFREKGICSLCTVAPRLSNTLRIKMSRSFWYSLQSLIVVTPTLISDAILVKYSATHLYPVFVKHLVSVQLYTVCMLWQENKQQIRWRTAQLRAQDDPRSVSRGATE